MCMAAVVSVYATHLQGLSSTQHEALQYYTTHSLTQNLCEALVNIKISMKFMLTKNMVSMFF